MLLKDLFLKTGFIKGFFGGLQVLFRTNPSNPLEGLEGFVKGSLDHNIIKFLVEHLGRFLNIKGFLKASGLVLAVILRR